MKRMIFVTLLFILPATALAHDAKLERLYALLELKIMLANSEINSISQTTSISLAQPSTQTTTVASDVTVDTQPTQVVFQPQPTQVTTSISSLDSIFAQTPTPVAVTSDISGSESISSANITAPSVEGESLLVTADIRSNSVFARASVTLVKDGEQYFLGTISSAERSKSFVMPTGITAPFTVDALFRGALLDSKSVNTAAQ